MDKLDPRRWPALIMVLLAAIMDIIDTSIVVVGIPAIQRDLRASASAMQWSIAAYTLAFALGPITGGRLGNIFGRKRIIPVKS